MSPGATVKVGKIPVKLYWNFAHFHGDVSWRLNDEQVALFPSAIQELQEGGAFDRGSKSTGIDRGKVAGRAISHRVVPVTGGIGDKERRSYGDREPVGLVTSQQLFLKQVRVVQAPGDITVKVG